ncbi:hypothetical protein GQ457_13G015680 [Hibiscus cannabinus]
MFQLHLCEFFNNLLKSKNPKLAAQVLFPFPYAPTFLITREKRGSAIYGLFGKEFPNIFAFKFIRVNYVEVEMILSWRLRIQVSRNQSCDFLRVFSLYALSPGNEERRKGLRARSSFKPEIFDINSNDEECRPWRRRLSMAFTWGSSLRIALLLLLLAAIVFACFTLPVEKILKDFLLWVDKDLGPWGPLVLAVAYIPLTVLAVPASVLTLGGGYLFGLPVGFIADSIGATLGAGAAFLLGRTIGRSFVVSKLKDYPQFRSVAIAIRRSGFKIVLLLRLVPLLPFNMMNYLLSVTPVPVLEYMLASWLGMMPITFALVYVGTTLKDLSDVTHGWSEFSAARWALLIMGLSVSVVLMICVTRVAKSALDKALAENEDVDSIIDSPQLPIVGEAPGNLHEPLIIKIDAPDDTHEK